MKFIISVFITLTFTAYASCPFDKKALLSLELKAFDQDMDGGWRQLAKKKECKPFAADLIQEYRVKNNANESILYWHEGQLRASLAQTERAIVLFEHARNKDDSQGFGWNYYVNATIAFLRRDKAQLEKNRTLLAQVEKPEELEMVDENGNPVDIPWPPNLNIVNSLIKCFDKSYSEAYANCH